MEIVELVARWGIALVLGLAAVAKLARPARTAAALREFGVPARVRGTGAYALPVAELVTAGLLVVPVTARAGAGCAVALLVVFTVAIARALARGRRPDCNCFGALRSAPVGRTTLLRNVTLTAVAAVVLVGGPGRPVTVSLSGNDALILAVAVALCLLLAGHAVFSYELFRQNGRLLERIAALEAHNRPGAGTVPAASAAPDGLPAGEPAPAFDLPDLDGRRVSLDDLLDGRRPLALAFLEPDCGACGPALIRLAEVRSRRGGDLAVAVVTRGAPAQARRRVNGYAFDGVLLQEGRELTEAFRIARVPSALMIDSTGRIASSIAVGVEAIDALLESVTPARLDVAGSVS